MCPERYLYDWEAIENRKSACFLYSLIRLHEVYNGFKGKTFGYTKDIWMHANSRLSVSAYGAKRILLGLKYIHIVGS